MGQSSQWMTSSHWARDGIVPGLCLSPESGLNKPAEWRAITDAWEGPWSLQWGGRGLDIPLPPQTPPRQSTLSHGLWTRIRGQKLHFVWCLWLGILSFGNGMLDGVWWSPGKQLREEKRGKVPVSFSTCVSCCSFAEIIEWGKSGDAAIQEVLGWVPFPCWVIGSFTSPSLSGRRLVASHSSQRKDDL